MLKLMNRYGVYIIIMASVNLGAIPSALGEEAETAPFEENTRDPLIPLIDEKGSLRKEFKKPSQETAAPQVVLMGISKVGNTFYALIDGELVKEGQVFKDMRIEKIYSDRVIVAYGNKTFELKWETEKK